MSALWQIFPVLSVDDFDFGEIGQVCRHLQKHIRSSQEQFYEGVKGLEYLL